MRKMISARPIDILEADFGPDYGVATISRVGNQAALGCGASSRKVADWTLPAASQRRLARPDGGGSQGEAAGGWGDDRHDPITVQGFALKFVDVAFSNT